MRKLLIEIICYTYILMFLNASVYKLLDIPLFERQLEQSRYWEVTDILSHELSRFRNWQ